MSKSEDPFFKYSIDELSNMTQEEFCSVIEESNEYVRNKYNQLNEQRTPKFNTIEELRTYYHCIPLEDAINKMNKLFDNK